MWAMWQLVASSFISTFSCSGSTPNRPQQPSSLAESAACSTASAQHRGFPAAVVRAFERSASSGFRCSHQRQRQTGKTPSPAKAPGKIPITIGAGAAEQHLCWSGKPTTARALPDRRRQDPARRPCRRECFRSEAGAQSTALRTQCRANSQFHAASSIPHTSSSWRYWRRPPAPSRRSIAALRVVLVFVLHVLDYRRRA